MLIAKFELYQIIKNKNLIDSYLNKNYYFLEISVANDYRYCCRRSTTFIEIHDSISLEQLKNWFINTKGNDLEVDQILIYKNIDDLLEDKYEKTIGGCNLNFEIKDYKNSIWKGWLENESFEIYY